MCYSSKIRVPSYFSACSFILKSLTMLVLNRSKFENLAVIIVTVEGSHEAGENAQLLLIFPFCALGNQISIEVPITAVHTVLSRQSFGSLLEGKCLVLIYNNIII